MSLGVPVRVGTSRDVLVTYRTEEWRERVKTQKAYGNTCEFR